MWWTRAQRGCEYENVFAHFGFDGQALAATSACRSSTCARSPWDPACRRTKLGPRPPSLRMAGWLQGDDGRPLLYIFPCGRCYSSSLPPGGPRHIPDRQHAQKCPNSPLPQGNQRRSRDSDRPPFRSRLSQTHSLSSLTPLRQSSDSSVSFSLPRRVPCAVSVTKHHVPALAKRGSFVYDLLKHTTRRILWHTAAQPSDLWERRDLTHDVCAAKTSVPQERAAARPTDRSCTPLSNQTRRPCAAPSLDTAAACTHYLAYIASR